MGRTAGTYSDQLAEDTSLSKDQLKTPPNDVAIRKLA